MINSKTTILNNKIPKKRKTSITPWRKDVDKYRRCQPKGPPLPPSCKHSYSKFECDLLGEREMESFHRKFYYTRNKAQQDAFILRHCQGRSPRRKSSVAQKERKLTVEYYVSARERNVQVCKEAFIGILRVNKSRINALLKSFYKIDNSKDDPRNEKKSSRLKGRCGGRGRKNGEGTDELTTNSKSLTNIEHPIKKDFSAQYRHCQSEYEKHDETSQYSISIKENVQEEKPISHQSESNSVIEHNNFDWLNLYSKARMRMTINWSTLRQIPYSESNTTIDGKVSDSPQKKNIPELSYLIKSKSHNTICQKNNFYKETAGVTSGQTIPTNPDVSLHDLSNVYESKKRRMRKLQTINGKENMNQKGIKKENNIQDSKPQQNIHNSKPEQKTKVIPVRKKYKTNLVFEKRRQFIQTKNKNSSTNS